MHEISNDYEISEIWSRNVQTFIMEYTRIGALYLFLNEDAFGEPMISMDSYNDIQQIIYCLL